MDVPLGLLKVNRAPSLRIGIAECKMGSRGQFVRLIVYQEAELVAIWVKGQPT